MSAQRFLERLLDGTSVEWLPLGQVTKYEQPTKYLVKSTNYDEKFKVPVLTAGKTFVLGYTDETSGIFEASKSPTIIFDDFTTANKWVDFDFKAKSSAMKMITASDDRKFSIKYVYHWLNTLPSGLVDGDHKRQWISNYCNKLVPIPCPEDPEKSLAIQAEIVRILDKFAELTAELTAELRARKQQYNYYLDQLLSFESGEAEWKALDEIGEFIRGKRFTKADYVDEGIDVIHYGEIYTKYGVYASEAFSQVSKSLDGSLKYAEPGDVVLTDVGETVEEVGKPVAWLGEAKVAIHDHCYAFRHELNAKYVAYCMQASSFVMKKSQYVARTKVNTLLIKAFGKAQIPVPYPNDAEKSMAEQDRIVAILDKFNTLTISLSEGLPREIKLRQQQYEFYRDLLLSFPKPEEAA